MRMIKLSCLLLASALTLSACATDEYGNRRDMTDTEKGALIGAGVGALLGLGAKNKSRAVLYGVVGGLTGADTGSVFTARRGVERTLFKLTIVLSAVFFILVLILVYIVG